jgi:hypothetical protein
MGEIAMPHLLTAAGVQGREPRCPRRPRTRWTCRTRWARWTPWTQAAIAALWLSAATAWAAPAAATAGPPPAGSDSRLAPQASVLGAAGRQAPPGKTASAPPLTASCTEGIHYDDGGFEDAVSAPVANGTQVMSFDLPAGADGVIQVCAALTRSTLSPSPDLALNVVFYAADGPQGGPGTLVAAVPAMAIAIPITQSAPVQTQFYAFTIGSALVLPAARTLYVGLQFDGSQGYFIGVDNSSTTAYRPTFASIDGGVTWQSEASADANPYHAFGLRIDPQLAATNCVPSTTAMCLQAQRFAVSAAYQAGSSGSGGATTVPLTVDSGYLWFFDASNIEAIVKVIDGCALNQRYWVFAGGLTNVNTTLTVTDTQTGAMKTYVNPQSTPFAPLQDTSAFPCP